MAAEEILLKYKADISDLQSKTVNIEAQIKKIDKAFIDLDKNKKKTFDGSAVEGFKGQLESLGKAIIGAFAIERVISFGKASFEAFAEAEKGETRLLVALKGRQDVQQRLLIQAKELQKSTGIEDDVIVAQQAFLASQNRTEAQIKKTIQAAVELSRVTGTSLEEAVRNLDGTFEGTIGRMGKLDAGFKNLTQEQLANGAAVDLVLEKYSGFAAQSSQTTQGALDKLSATFNDLEESIGKVLAKGGGFISFLTEISAGLTRFFTSNFDAAVQNNIEETTTATDAFIKSFEEFRKSSKEKGDIRSDFQLASVFIKQANADIIAAGKELTNATDKEQKSRLTKRIAILQAEKKALEKFVDDEAKAREAAAKVGAAAAAEAAKKAAEEETKRLEEQAKSRETLRQFTLKSLQDNADEDNTIRKKGLFESIKDEEARNLAFLESDKQTLEEQRKNAIEFAESTKDIDDKLLANKIAIGTQTGKVTKAFLDDTLKEIEQNAKDQIEVLSKVKDDPSTKIDEEKEAQHKILDIRKGAVGQSIFLLEQLKDLGIITEQQYTDAVAKLSQDRKMIRQDEINQGLKDEEDAKQKRIKTIQDLQAAYEILSSAIKEGTDAIFNSQIQSLQDQDAANKDFFDKQQEDINNNVQKRITTEAQGEQKSAKLKEKRTESEKKSNEEIKKLKRQQAEIDKLLSIFKIGLVLAEAIAELDAFKIAAASVQLGVVIATPVPKFKAGASWVERGRNAMGEDTIPAMLDEGERVVSRTKNIKHWDIYEAIDQGRLNQYVMRNFVTPALKNQQKTFEERKQKTFADNIGQSLIYNGLTYHEADRIRRKGTRITNEESLAKSVAKELVKEMNAQKYLG